MLGYQQKPEQPVSFARLQGRPSPIQGRPLNSFKTIIHVVPHSRTLEKQISKLNTSTPHVASRQLLERELLSVKNVQATLCVAIHAM